MDFIRSTSEKMNLWPVEHFFPLFFSRSALNQHWSGKKRGKKVFNSSEFHFFGSISYEIHILMKSLTSTLYLLSLTKLNGTFIQENYFNSYFFYLDLLSFIFRQGTLLFVKQCTSCFDLQELRYFKKKVATTYPLLTSM